LSRELKNATITHVSYVDKGANKKKFFLTKSEQEPNFEKDVRVLVNKDDKEQLVYGVVYEPDMEDSHGDVMKATEIEKSAHKFLKEYRNIDKQHDFESGVGEVVESYVTPTEMTVGGETITKGTWVLVTKASNDIWEGIQKGEITGYSMAGTAEVEELEKGDDTTMLNRIAKVMSQLLKGEVKDKFNEARQRRDMFSAMYIFEDVVYDEMFNIAPNSSRITLAANDFADVVQQLVNEPVILKSMTLPTSEVVTKRIEQLQKFQIELEKREEIDVNKEDLQAVIKEAMEPVTKRLDELEKTGDVDPKPDPVKKGDVDPKPDPAEKGLTKEDVAEVVKAALQPVADRLETVEKARGISNSDQGGQEKDIEKDENVWKGLL